MSPAEEIEILNMKIYALEKQSMMTARELADHKKATTQAIKILGTAIVVAILILGVVAPVLGAVFS